MKSFMTLNFLKNKCYIAYEREDDNDGRAKKR
jgi:hypothetical protein